MIRSLTNLVLMLCSPAATGLTVSVATVGPLQYGEDELVYTVGSGEEDLGVTALMETQGLTCGPTSIVSFKSNCCSVLDLASDPQAVCIISSAAEEAAVEDYHMPTGPVTTSGVTEVVAMAEVSMTDRLLVFKE